MSAPTAPTTGTGCTLGFSTIPVAATPVIVPIGRLKTFDPDGVEIAKVETTDLGSDAAESIPGLPDNGSIGGSVYVIAGNPAHVQLRDWGQKSAVTYWQIQLNDGSTPTTGTTMSFYGWLSKWKTGGYEINTPIMGNFTIQVTGKVTTVDAT